MSEREDALSVAPLPPPPADGAQPYLRMLYGTLSRRGVSVERIERIGPRAVRRHDVDVVHLHWLEYLTKDEGPPGVRAARAHWRALRLVAALLALRPTRTRVVWTVHNLRPHEPRFPWLEAAIARATAWLADALIVHSRYAGARAAARVGGAAKLHVIPHGNFRELYSPSRRTREEVRAELGLPASGFTFLVFGQLRRYKRVPETIAAFRETGNRDHRLVVAGAVRDAALRAAIEEAAAGDERVRLRLGFVPDEEVADLHRAADAAIVAYREVFSSGALLLALGFGLPVLAPAEGTAAELAGPPAVFTFGQGGLTAGMEMVAAAGSGERPRQAALEAALEYSWDAIADETLRVYGGLRRPEGRSVVRSSANGSP